MLTEENDPTKPAGILDNANNVSSSTEATIQHPRAPSNNGAILFLWFWILFLLEVVNVSYEIVFLMQKRRLKTRSRIVPKAMSLAETFLLTKTPTKKTRNIRTLWRKQTTILFTDRTPSIIGDYQSYHKLK